MSNDDMSALKYVLEFLPREPDEQWSMLPTKIPPVVLESHEYWNYISDNPMDILLGIVAIQTNDYALPYDGLWEIRELVNHWIHDYGPNEILMAPNETNIYPHLRGIYAVIRRLSKAALQDDAFKNVSTEGWNPERVIQAYSQPYNL